MPPLQKVTKEMVLDAGYQIIRESGIDHVNARSIASFLSCSTQPIYSCFATMDELREALFSYTCTKLVKEVLKNEEQPDFLHLCAAWYLNLLRKEPHLYRFLYFSYGFSHDKLSDFLAAYTSNQAISKKMQLTHGLDPEDCHHILLRTFSLLHGFGALVSFNSFTVTDEEILALVRQTATEMLHSAKASQESGD